MRLLAVCSDYCRERLWVLGVIVSQYLTESEIISLCVWGLLALFIILLKKLSSVLRNTPRAAGKILKATHEIVDPL